MTFKLTSAQRRQLAKENAKWPHQLHPVPREEWPSAHPELLEVWRSRGFLVQIMAEKHGHIRLTACRTMQRGDGWIADITWDELMQLKRECGRGDQDALELFPADRDVVNVANMRHLFFPPTPVLFKWMGGE
jgi:hypothetical protein